MLMKRISLLSALVLGSFPAYAVVTEQDIQQLQQQINSLQQSINQASAQQSSKLSKWISTDTAMPFGGMPDTAMAITLLKAKENTLSAPVILGGELEFDTQYWDGAYKVPRSPYSTGTGSGIAVTTASLYTGANFNSWSQGLVNYALSGNQLTVPLALINFGNLLVSPFYATVGDTYLPFGVFNDNGPWSNTLTTNLFRTDSTNQVTLGWDYNQWNANIGAYDSTDYRQELNDYVFNLNYNLTTNNNSYGVGMSYLTDVRGTNAVLGSSYTTANPTPEQPLSGGANPALDLNADININAWGAALEYVSTLSKSVEVRNTSGNLMSTWDAGVTYSFNLAGLPTQYLLSYSATDHMNDIQMPLNGSAGNSVNSLIGIQQQWLTSIDIQVANNMYLGPEFTYDRMYNGAGTTVTTLDFSAYF